MAKNLLKAGHNATVYDIMPAGMDDVACAGAEKGGSPKDVASLKKQFPRTGFVEQWNRLEQSAKDFSKELLGKQAATPSSAWVATSSC